MVEIIQKMVGDYSAAKIVSEKIMNLPSQYNMTRKKYGRVTVKLSYKNWFIHCPKIIFLLFIIFMAWASKFFSFICRILSGLSLKKYTSQYSILSILLSCITFHYITRFVRTKLTKSYIVSETFLPTTCPQLPPPCIRPLLWTRTHFFQSKSIISHSK